MKKNQIEYYDRISEVRRSGNYEQWVRFFLEAVSSAAQDALESAQKLSVLHDNNVARLPKPSRSKDNVRALFDYLEQHPIIDIKRTAADLSISYNTTATAVRKLQELGILKETTNAARNRVFAYEDYLHILRQGTWYNQIGEATAPSQCRLHIAHLPREHLNQRRKALIFHDKWHLVFDLLPIYYFLLDTKSSDMI